MFSSVLTSNNSSPLYLNADINECKANLHHCDAMAYCLDKEGSYNCVCKEGYESVGTNKTAYEGQCKGMLTEIKKFQNRC